jgi:hypothetical protein
MILALDLRQEFLNVIQIPSGFQSHLMGTSAIRAALGRRLNCQQARAQRLIDNLPEGRVEFRRDGSRFVQNVVVYDQCCSHVGIMRIRTYDVKASARWRLVRIRD